MKCCSYKATTVALGEDIYSSSAQGETWMGADGPLFICSVSFTVLEERIINWTGLVQKLEIVHLLWEGVGSLKFIFSVGTRLPLAVCRCPEKYYFRD